EVGEGNVFGAIVFNINKPVPEPAVRQSLVRPLHVQGFRAVMTDKPGRHGHSEAVKVELAARIAALHLLLQRPADILQLSVADLKTVSYLYTARIMPQFFRHPVQ